MEIINLLDFTDRIELREWLKVNHNRVKSCWVVTSRSKQPTYECIPYIEVVEEALCFGWIDSTLKKLPDGCLAQRLSPHRKGSHWTELNKERCINLEDRGLMTDAGHQAFEKAYSTFPCLQTQILQSFSQFIFFDQSQNIIIKLQSIQHSQVYSDCYRRCAFLYSEHSQRGTSARSAI